MGNKLETYSFAIYSHFPPKYLRNYVRWTKIEKKKKMRNSRVASHQICSKDGSIPSLMLDSWWTRLLARNVSFKRSRLNPVTDRNLSRQGNKVSRDWKRDRDRESTHRGGGIRCPYCRLIGSLTARNLCLSFPNSSLEDSSRGVTASITFY